MISTRCLLLPAVALSLVQSFALSIGQVDDFEDGTTQNWVTALLGSPNPAPPVNFATGGPGGTDDNFLHLTALGGGGPGSRLSAINFNGQWAGDYLAEGIGSISMDVNNSGSSDLHLRLMFADPTVGPPDNIAFSSDAIVVPAGSGWVHLVFPIAPAALIAGLGDLETALRNATEIRLYHSDVPNFPNPVVPIPTIVASLGVDNIRAAAPVPDTSCTMTCLAASMAVLAVASRVGARS
jgi:hypothetical protein